MATIRTSLHLCAICTEPPYPNDGDCDCAVDMKVCDLCGRGPLNDSDPETCGEEDCHDAAGRGLRARQEGLPRGC